MLTLTKAALHGTVPDENLFVDSNDAKWKELFELSAAQGVMVLSLNGAMRLPKALQPQHSVKFRWVASVEAVEKRYQHCLKTAKELSACFKENNIQMLLFKGIALSRLYPAPSSREFGDIDIFLCGKAKEGDALLERITGIKSPSPKKHSHFSYKKILIENHHTFLSQNSSVSFQDSKNLEKQLLKILTEAGMMDAESTQRDETLLFPPPDFDALFVTLHTLSHFPFGIVLRQLCDLTVLFTTYEGKIDFSLYRNTLSKAGLLKLADILISLSIKYLDLNTEYIPQYESDLSLENRIWNDMLNPEIPPLPKEKRTIFNTLIFRIKSFRSRYWKSELVFPNQYGKRIFSSTVNYLRNPGIIGNLF